MKVLSLVLSFIVSAAAFAEVTVSDVIVRQQWPWNTSVNVDFIVSGTEGRTVQFVLRAYRGTQALGYLPYSAMSGDVAVASDGEKRIVFDPGEVAFLSGLPTITDFRIEVSADDGENGLYMIVDLAKTGDNPGSRTFVTESALTNGMWGAWERSPCGMIEDSVVWTGVTQDIRYATSCLVLRRIPAGSFTYGTDPAAAYANGNEIPVSSVGISADYWIGVFEFTRAQYAYVFGDAVSESDTKLAWPKTGLFYGSYTAKDCIRGAASLDDYDWPGDKNVRGSTVMGMLRAKTSLGFDLPTEAQWNKAARAGSAGPYYHTDSLQVSDANIGQVAWYVNNCGEKFHPVGMKKPNDYGLYDVLGNAAEWVLDWYEANHVPSAEDPEGPLSDPEGTKLRVNAGGNYYGYPSKSGSSPVLHLGWRNGFKYSEQPARSGFRVCCPAQ